MLNRFCEIQPLTIYRVSNVINNLMSSTEQDAACTETLNNNRIPEYAELSADTSEDLDEFLGGFKIICEEKS